MKKILITILAIFYLGVSSGATVHFHYCMGNLVSLGLSSKEKVSCSFCGMPKSSDKKKSCCKDDYKQVKVYKSQKIVQTVYQFKQPAATIHYLKARDEFSYSLNIASKIALSDVGIGLQQIPLFIRNCNYRI